MKNELFEMALKESESHFAKQTAKLRLDMLQMAHELESGDFEDADRLMENGISLRKNMLMLFERFCQLIGEMKLLAEARSGCSYIPIVDDPTKQVVIIHEHFARLKSVEETFPHVFTRDIPADTTVKH
jgi:hypothetical protein